MNIVTHEFVRRIKDRRLQDFVSRWDNLEALVISIYRMNYAAEEEHAAHQLLRDWLSAHYPRFQAALRPHWQSARIGGEIIQADPFLEILAVMDAGGFAGNWRAMQTLPAAREALNGLLLSIIAGSAPIENS